jgi:hypothetical protein
VQAIAAELAAQERLMAQQFEYGGGDWLEELEEGGEGAAQRAWLPWCCLVLPGAGRLPRAALGVRL